MRVSVFIPTYNYARFLPQAIESVLAQTMKPCEIIIADDGSTDETAELVAGYGDAVRYVRFDNLGVYTVRDAVLKMLKGDWFLNLDADNWIEPDFLEQAAALIASCDDDKLGFVYPDAQTFGDYVRFQPVPAFNIERFKLGNFVDMNSLVRTNVAQHFGFDSAFNDGWGDYDFFLSLAENGFYGIPLRSSRLHYRVHAESITAETKVFDRKQQLMRRIVEKHSDFFSLEEGKRAIHWFAPEGVMRHRLCELWWARRYGEALRLGFRTLFKHPHVFFSFAVLKFLWRGWIGETRLPGDLIDKGAKTKLPS